MSLLTISPQDIENISSILKKQGYDKLYQSFTSHNQMIFLDRYGWDIENLPLISERHYIGANFIDDIAQYFKEKHNFNLYKVYEEKLTKHRWQDHLVEGLIKAVKEKKYVLDNNSLIMISQNYATSSKKTYENFFILITLCADDKTFIKASANVLQKLQSQLSPTLLELEKYKKRWEKRIKDITIEELSVNEDYQTIKRIFSKLDNPKEKQFVKVINGLYHRCEFDIDVLSQQNRLSFNKNQDALRIFFTQFNNYIKSSERGKEILGITDFKFDQNCITFYFIEEKNRTLIESLTADLIDYAMTKEDKNNLKGANSIQSVEKFFTPFLMNYSLQKSLIKKENTNKISKKI